MIGKNNRPESEISKRIEAILTSEETSFRGLLTDGGFDPSVDFRFKNLSGLSLAGEDLRGIDFTGSNLVGCNFAGALIEGARFDRARLGMRGLQVNIGSTLHSARDWSAHVQGWKPSSTNGGPIDVPDEHLPIGALFCDAPHLPLMVVLPFVRSGTRPARVAVSVVEVKRAEFMVFERTQENDDKKLQAAIKAMTDDDGASYAYASWSDVTEYTQWAKRVSGRAYRPLDEAEWEFACKGAFYKDKNEAYGLRPKENWYLNCWEAEKGWCLSAKSSPPDKKLMRVVESEIMKEYEDPASFRVARDLLSWRDLVAGQSGVQRIQI